MARTIVAVKNDPDEVASKPLIIKDVVTNVAAALGIFALIFGIMTALNDQLRGIPLLLLAGLCSLGIGALIYSLFKRSATQRTPWVPVLLTALCLVGSLGTAAIVNMSEDPSTTTTITSATSSSTVTTTPLAPVTVTPDSRGIYIYRLTPLADTYANQDALTTNFGSQPVLFSRGNPGEEAYLRFELPIAPPGTVLSEAWLRIHTSTEDFAGSAEPHDVLLGDNSWDESKVTWSLRPGLSSIRVGLIEAPERNRSYEFSLAVEELRRLVGRQTQLTFGITSKRHRTENSRIRTEPKTDDLGFWSSNRIIEELRPEMRLVFIPS